MSYKKLCMLVKALKFFREKQGLVPKSEIDALFDKIDDRDKLDIDELISELEEERDRLNKSKKYDKESLAKL